MSNATLSKPVPTRFKDTSDGHGARFEIHLENGLADVPQDIVTAMKIALEKGRATLYVDGIRTEGNNLVISLCHGSIRLATVDGHWNHQRKDKKYHVIMRQEIDTDSESNLPNFNITE